MQLPPRSSPRPRAQFSRQRRLGEAQDTLEELEEMYPTYGEGARKIGRFIRIAI